MANNYVELKDVRISFPQLIEAVRAKGFPESDPKFSADFIMDPSHPGYAEAHRWIAELLTVKYKDKAPQVKALADSDKSKRFYGKGEERVDKKTFAVYEGYAGKVYISAKCIRAPGIYLPGTRTMADPTQHREEARKIYAGCYVNAAIRPYLQSEGGAIRCDLLGVQFIRDGEPFGEGNVDVSGMFGDAPDNGFSTPATPSFMK